MTLPVLFSRRAERALVEIHARYSSVFLPLGEAFLAETDQLAVRISRTPLVFPSLYRDVRRARLRRFPYGMLYRVMDDLELTRFRGHLSLMTEGVYDAQVPKAVPAGVPAAAG